MMDLPETTQQAIIYVDATPDEEYPLRILRVYRENCNCQWSDSTDPNKIVENPLLKSMNDDQDKRADILDRAIAKLENRDMLDEYDFSKGTRGKYVSYDGRMDS